MRPGPVGAGAIVWDARRPAGTAHPRRLLAAEVLALAVTSARTGGGPFAALVCDGTRVVARGTNRVVPGSDPTAHAEIEAIRAAGRALGTHVLEGLVMYASCEPCPMCLAAILWARLEGVVFLASGDDAARAGWDDRFVRDMVVGRSPLRVALVPAGGLDSWAPFAAWLALPDRQAY